MELVGFYVIIWFTTTISWKNALAVKLKSVVFFFKVKNKKLRKKERVSG